MNHDPMIAAAVERITQRTFEAPKLGAEALVERMAGLADAVARAIPRHASHEQAQHAIDAGIADLRLYARRSTWPMPAEVLDAIAKHAPPAPPTPTGVSAARISRAVQWWDKFGDVPSWWADEETIRGMVAAGVDPVLMRRAHAPVPRDLLPRDFGRTR